MPTYMEVDRNAIIANYRSMLDAELIALARKDGVNLTSEAFVLLREELHRRNIGMEELEKLEHEIILRASLQKVRFTEDLNKDLFKRAVELLLKSKGEGKSKYEVYVALIELGIDEDRANYLVNRADLLVSDLKLKGTDEFREGIFVLVIGFGFVYFASILGNYQFLAYGVPLFGVLKMIGGSRQKSFAEKILANDWKEHPDASV